MRSPRPFSPRELPFAKGSFWSITPGFERFDVVTEPVSRLASSPFRARAVVFDKDDLAGRIPPPSLSRVSAAVVAQLVEDWYHFSAMLETVLWRRDWLLGTEHLHFLMGLLYQGYVASNQPLPPMGTKQWSAKLTDAQRSALEQLPTAVIDAEKLVAAHLAYSRAFLPVARSLAVDVDVEWPRELESAATRHLRTVLNIDEPYPQ